MPKNSYSAFALDFTREAGDIILEKFGQVIESQRKADRSLVTKIDKIINDKLIKMVKESFPHHRVLGEEASSGPIDSEFTWVIDPLDGTQMFFLGIPTFVTSLALVDSEGKVVLGVIYDPLGGKMYFAERGKGAILNGQSISVSQQSVKDLPETIVDVDLGCKGDHFNILPIVPRLVECGITVVNFGSTFYTSALVASGKLLADIYPGRYAHDAAAVKIIVEEAGGIVTDLFGKDQRYDQPIKGYLASSKQMHPFFLDFLEKSKITG